MPESRWNPDERLVTFAKQERRSIHREPTRGPLYARAVTRITAPPTPCPRCGALVRVWCGLSIEDEQTGAPHFEVHTPVRCRRAFLERHHALKEAALRLLFSRCLIAPEHLRAKWEIEASAELCTLLGVTVLDLTLGINQSAPVTPREEKP